MDPLQLRMAHREMYEKNSTSIETTTATNEVHCSSTLFSNLRATRITGLPIEEAARGCYLLLRTIEEPILDSITRTVVEDHEGNLSNFCAHNYFDLDLDGNKKDVLPVGTVFVLKEPLLTADPSKGFTLYCYSPTDIIVLQKHHKLYSLTRDVLWKNELHVNDLTLKEETLTSEEWKTVGNEHFKNRLFNKALEAYFSALSDPNVEDNQLQKALYCNISAAYLRLEFFERALHYSKMALKIDANDVKALYRAGRAHYELRQYEDARACFENALRQGPENKETLAEHTRCSFRLEEKAGKTDIYRLFLTSTLKPKTKIHCADYTGPLKIVQIPGKGRGTVATEDIKPGTLLVVSKAIQAFFNESTTGVTFQRGDRDDITDHSDNARFVTKIAHTVMKNPNVYGPVVYDLCSSDDSPAKLFCDDDSKEEPIADIKRIRKIINFNCYSIEGPNAQERAATFSPLDDGSGLFVMPAYMNHSCLFNASWQTYNDVMVVFAVKDVRRGEEVSLSYFNSLKTFAKREQICSKRMFRCTCLLCQLDGEDFPRAHEKRFRLLRKIEVLVQKMVVSSDKMKVANEIQRVVMAMEKSYEDSKRSRLRTALMVPRLKMALGMMQRGQLPDLLKILDKSLDSFELSLDAILRFVEEGVSLPEDSLVSPMIFHVIVMVICGHSFFGSEQDAKRWLNVLLSLEKIYAGGNLQMVKTKYKNVPEPLYQSL